MMRIFAGREDSGKPGPTAPSDALIRGGRSEQRISIACCLARYGLNMAADQLEGAAKMVGWLEWSIEEWVGLKLV
jgi:hypothetical protein